MDTEKRDFILEGRPVRVIFHLAWPLIFYNIAEAIFNFVDAFFLGRIGAAEFSAPLVSWPLILIFVAFVNGVLGSGTPIISRLYGKGEIEKIKRVTGSLIFLSLIFYLPFGIIPSIYIHTVMRWVILDHSVANEAVTYSYIILIGILPHFVFMAMYNAFLGVGDTKTPSKYIIIANLINIALDPIFIFGFWIVPRMEVTGAAIASVIAHSIVVPFLFIEMRRNRIFNGLGLVHLMPDRQVIIETMKIGSPIGLQNALNNLGHTMFISIVSRYGGYAVAAYGITIVVFNIVYMFTYGIQRALASAIGISLGAKRIEVANRYWREALKIMTSIMLAIGVIFIVFTEEITIFLVKDVSVVQYSQNLLYLIGLTMPFFGWIYIVGGVAIGSGDTFPYMLLTIIRLWVIRIGLAYSLYYLLQVSVNAIWSVLAASNVAAGIIGLMWVAKGGWTKKEINV